MLILMTIINMTTTHNNVFKTHIKCTWVNMNVSICVINNIIHMNVNICKMIINVNINTLIQTIKINVSFMYNCIILM